MAEINEELQDLKSSIQELSMILSNMGPGFTDTKSAMGGLASSAKQATTSQTEFARKSKVGFDDLLRSVNAATGSITKLSSAAFNSANSFDFASKAIGTVASTASSAASQFGNLGKGTGFLIEAFSTIVQSVLSFGTSALDAKDIISSMGAAGRITSKEIESMASGARMYGANMVKYAKIVKDIGPDILALGGNVEEGVLAFGKFTTLTKEQIASYQKLGINQEQLIAGLADYVKIQTQSGVLITKEMVTSGKLQKAALEYTEKLNELAQLTGVDVDNQKKRQFQIATDYAWQVKNIQLEERLAEAKQNGNKEQIQAIQNEIAGRKRALEVLALIDDANTRAAAASYLLGGAYDTQNSGLIQLRVNMEEYRQSMIAGKDIMPLFTDIMSNVRRTASEYAGALTLPNSKDLAKTFLLSSENLSQSTRMHNKTLEEGTKAEQDRTRTVLAGKDKPDPLEGMRERFMKVMLSLQEELQKLADLILKRIYPSFLKLADWLETGIPLLGKKIENFINNFESGLDSAKIALGAFAAFVGVKLVAGLTSAMSRILGVGALAAPGAATIATGGLGLSLFSAGVARGPLGQDRAEQLAEEQKQTGFTWSGAGDDFALGSAILHAGTFDNKPSSTSRSGSTGSGRGSYGMPLVFSGEGINSIDPLKGLNIKSNESIAGGKTSYQLVQMAHNINSMFPGATFTALNDRYHQGFNSKHNKGLALDFTLARPPKTREEAARIKEYLYQMGATKVLDEYFADKSPNSTGGHFHVEVGNKPIPGLTMPNEPSSGGVPTMPSAASTGTPNSVDVSRNSSSSTNVLSSVSLALMDKIDLIVDKLNKTLSVQEDILKYAKFKS